MEEAERVADMEDWSAVAKDTLCQALRNQESIQAKLTDQEARSQRNNIQLYGIPEDAKGDNIQELIESFFKTELSLPDFELGIRRCDRALGLEPPENANPRSVVICFLEYKTELVLRTAWRKGEVYLNQDYPAETPIRRLLKEKGLRFQTPPPAKLWSHHIQQRSRGDGGFDEERADRGEQPGCGLL